MGRRKRRTITPVRRRRRSAFLRCPSCQHNSITVEVSKKDGKAIIRCYNCGLVREIEMKPGEGKIDAYTRFFDAFIEGQV
ncbi:MAG: transcription elongation factor 1 family protein [Candidatus Korarchaeum sp.]|jgi:transcription elongation factor Elf1|nr:transcription elongation factor 1 family protein [Candidatus Korarchaeum sp.]